MIIWINKARVALILDRINKETLALVKVKIIREVSGWINLEITVISDKIKEKNNFKIRKEVSRANKRKIK